MKQGSGHITRKVILSYILLIAIAVCSVAYIYDVIVRLTVEDEPDTAPRQKVYIITKTLSLLYESEALGQLVGMSKDDYYRYNQTLNKAQSNIDSLRSLVSDSIQILKIDTINNLLERKRWNTRQLLKTLAAANTEYLYRKSIEKVIAVQDTAVEQLKIEERVVIKQDTLVVKKKPRGFFKRLAEVFVPEKQDTGIVVNTTRHIVTDTVVKTFNPADTIMSVLRGIQDSVAGQRRQLDTLLLARTNNLRYNNSVITQRINQMLRDIEQEEMDASLTRVRQRQDLLRETSGLIALIAVVSLVIALIFLFFIWRDISRSQYYRKQLEKAKQYAEDLLHSREKLMLTISHDIRAPLSSIIGYIELLEHLGPNERERYYLGNMTGSASHILALVNDLLDFHRLESNQMEVHLVPFNIPSLFSEIYTSFRPIAENKGLQFVFNLKEENKLLQYMGDPIRIRQIAGNLLSNAIKFTREGRVTLVVATSQKTDKSVLLVFMVVDAGPGIPINEQEKIFGEFTRLSSTDKAEGFGLGLSITRKLTQLMGGKLSLDSVLGKGSTFRVELPLAASVVQNLPFITQVQHEETFVSVGTIHCLLVDDDPLQLAMTEELLRNNAIEVTCCSCSEEVVSKLHELAYDIVITDIQMPGMDGFILLKQIRESQANSVKELPVIALSANLTKDNDYYTSAGFSAFLNKPFTGRQLVALINLLLKKNRNKESVEELNFSSLTSFAGDDAEASANILRTFCLETRKNIVIIERLVSQADRNQVANIVHKLIPHFTMLGISDLTEQMRTLEKNDPLLPLSEWMDLVDKVIKRVSVIVEDVGQKIVE